MQQWMKERDRTVLNADVDLFRAVERGARVAVRNRRARGETDEEIRRRLVLRFWAGIAGGDLDASTREALVATVQRAVDLELCRVWRDA